MSRTLERGLNGPDVALAQRDLNVWYRYWEAPVREILDEDGDLGAKTELAFRRVRARLAHEGPAGRSGAATAKKISSRL